MPTTDTYTPGTYNWEVPAGVTEFALDLIAPSGGTPPAAPAGAAGGAGGKGARVQGTLAVSPGDEVDIVVGVEGDGGTAATNTPGGDGGGLTAVYLNGVLVAVAGSGGGGGVGRLTGPSPAGGPGGDGGYPTGSDGAIPAGSPYGGFYGRGGTQSAGGDSGGGSSTAGTYLTGGDGGQQFSRAGGGSGGAGYYGGGGGNVAGATNTAGNGGGGGPSWTHTTLVTSVTHTNGYNTGDGSVALTYESSETIDLSGSASLTLTASGAIDLARNLTASAALALDAVGGTPERIAPLAGSAHLALDAAGQITGTVTMAGSAALSLDATGRLEDRTIDLTGAAVLALDAAGHLVRVSPLAGAALLSLDATGVLSRTRIGIWTDVYSLGDVGTIATTLITWTATIPDGCTVTVETAIGDGDYTAVQNGAAIPGIPPGANVAGVSLHVRVTLTSDDESTTPEVSSLRVEARPADSSHLAPLGVFGIADVRTSETSTDLRMEITGYDRARRIQRARFTTPYVVPAGTAYTEAIIQLVESRAPGRFTYRFDGRNDTAPLLVFGESTDNDPLQAAQEMAASLGCVLYVDPAGVLVLEPAPNPETSAPAWEFTDADKLTVISIDRSLTDEGAYNGVIVTGESANATDEESEPLPPVRAEAWDEDRESPTWRNGPYGQVPYFLTSNMITTPEQAQAAANAQLRRVLGAIEVVTFTAIPVPTLDVDDVILLRSDRSRVSGRFIIDRLTMPLSLGDPMTVTCRQRRLAS